MFGAMVSAPLATPAGLPITPQWQWSRLPALAATELYAALAARQRVFAVEQNCAYLDADGHDAHAWHLLGWTHDGAAAELAAYLRVIDAGRKHVEPSIGRVLTMPAYRGTGLGRLLMTQGIVRARAVWPGHPIRISAQMRLEAFYASLAFRTVSAPFQEDGIAHVEMLLDVC